MKSTLIIEDGDANTYFQGYEIIGFFPYAQGEDSHVNLEFAREGDEQERHILLECAEQSLEKTYDRVCDSMINHPHVIDLRGLSVKIEVLR